MTVIQHKKTLHCLIALSFGVSSLLSSASAHAEDPRSLKHPLIGYWESKLPETECMETYWFREDGVAAFTSGDEQLEAKYEVTPQPDEHGFFKLTHRVTQSNKAKDCTKQLTETNKEVVSYLLFRPDGYSFISCDDDDPALETCFGPIVLRNNAQKNLSQ